MEEAAAESSIAYADVSTSAAAGNTGTSEGRNAEPVCAPRAVLYRHSVKKVFAGRYPNLAGLPPAPPGKAGLLAAS
jgi:hypothetical protein